MMRTSVLVISAFLGLAGSLIACSSADETPDPCVKNPKAKACAPAAAAPATSATPYQAPVANTPPVPPPAAVDAGPKPGTDAAPPPAANATACTDLLRCCNKIADNIERAGCMAIGYKAELDTCATAAVACESGIFTPTPGSGSNPSDPCSGFSDSTRSNGQNDYQCCVYGYSQVPTACCGTDNAGCQE